LLSLVSFYSFSIFGDRNRWRPAPATVNDESDHAFFDPIFIQYIIIVGSSIQPWLLFASFKIFFLTRTLSVQTGRKTAVTKGD
jgi:hypothetical protein